MAWAYLWRYEHSTLVLAEKYLFVTSNCASVYVIFNFILIQYDTL